MKKYLSKAEIDALANIIHSAEEHSTGEIRIHIDSSTEKYSKEKAFKVFQDLEMHKTKYRNAVLFHINFYQRHFTIIGDEGIHEKVFQHFWDEIHNEMKIALSEGNYFIALKNAILKTGVELKKHFPIDKEDNINELSNEVTFS